MSNQLTPMQEAIEKVNQLAMDNKTIKQVVFILTELLPKEQQVIEDAVNDTNAKWYSSRAEVILKGIDYYNTKFKQK